MNVNVAQAELKKPPRTGFREIAIECIVVLSVAMLLVAIAAI